MAYTTTALLKTYLGISGSGDDTLLGDIITRAQAMIDSYCRRTFEAAADTTRNFDPTTDVVNQTLWLDEDLCAITTVTNGDSTTIASSEYVTEPRNKTPYHGLTIKASSTAYWTYSTTHENSISIEGKWAYSTSAPDDIVHATIRLAAYLYRQKDNVSDIGGAAVVGDATLLPVDLPADIKRTLAPYRKVVI